MEYTTLGDTGATVSRLALGCMSFGSEHEWMLDEEEGRELIERAIDLGITFFDTANVYSNGESEAILGDVLAEYDRDRFTVATKVYGQMDESNPNSGGLSRKAIEQELDNSLDRLGMETIDLYQIHRWDYDTPIEETLATLDDAVRRGKARYVGASSMWTHQFAEALHTSDREGCERFVTMQNLYNLAYREEEREMVPLCEREGIGMIPWSPVGAGYLARPYEQDDATTRGEHETALGRPYREGGGGRGDQPPDRGAGRREGRADGPDRAPVGGRQGGRRRPHRRHLQRRTPRRRRRGARRRPLGVGRGVVRGAVRAGSRLRPRVTPEGQPRNRATAPLCRRNTLKTPLYTHTQWLPDRAGRETPSHPVPDRRSVGPRPRPRRRGLAGGRRRDRTPSHTDPTRTPPALGLPERGNAPRPAERPRTLPSAIPGVTPSPITSASDWNSRGDTSRPGPSATRSGADSSAGTGPTAGGSPSSTAGSGSSSS